MRQSISIADEIDEILFAEVEIPAGELDQFQGQIDDLLKTYGPLYSVAYPEHSPSLSPEQFLAELKQVLDSHGES